MQPKESVRLIQVSRWRSTARIDDISQSSRSCSLRNQFGSYKSDDGDQQLALTTSAKSRSCSLRNQFGSYKSVDGDQQLALTTSAKSRSCTLRNQFISYKSADGDHAVWESEQLRKDNQRRSAAQFDELHFYRSYSLGIGQARTS